MFRSFFYCVVFEANDREKAKEFVARYDKAIGEDGGVKVHRVSHYLASKGKGCLGTDLRTFAAGGRMSTLLANEILAYSLVMLDDSMQESPHAQVSRIVQRAPASNPPWWSATARLDQNIAVQSSIEAIDKSRFVLFFKNWKAIGQLDFHSFARLVPKRIKTKPFLDMVYRTGPHNRQDWSWLSDKRPWLASAHATSSPNTIQKVKIDFLKRACQVGTIFTWPRESNVNSLQDICQGSLVRDIDWELMECDRPMCLKVLSVDFARKKYVSTDGSRQPNSMRLPAIVQHYGIWNYDKNRSLDQLDVYLDGHPTLVDLFVEVEFVAYQKLCHWTMEGPSDVAGCWSLVRPQIYDDTPWCRVERRNEEFAHGVILFY